MSATGASGPAASAAAWPPAGYPGDGLGLVPRVLTKLFSFWVSTTYPFASVGRNLSMHYTTALSRGMAPGIKIGNAVVFRKHSWINTFNLVGPDDLKIVIDDECFIGPWSVISAKNSIELEQAVVLGASVLIQDHNHAYEDLSRPIKAQGVTPGGTIRIEQGCWIGNGAAILCPSGGLVLGHHSVVLPNSVIMRSAPPHSLLGGNPARVLERLDSAKSRLSSPST